MLILASTGHATAAGSEAGTVAVRRSAGAMSISFMFLLVYRLVGTRPAAIGVA